MVELSVVGKSVLRRDSLVKALGKAEYCSDINLLGMLHAKVLRSPYPHARIVNIDTFEAEKVPGVRCVVTGRDAPQKLSGPALVKDKNMLARGVVRYIGEPVAAVAADTIEVAEEAIDLIKITYEKIPAVFDVEEAAGTQPPAIVHPDFSKYTKFVPEARLAPEQPNVILHMKLRKGDIARGFAEADLIMENRFFTPPIQHCPLETHVVVVRPEADGGVTIHTGRQGVWGLKGEISDTFGIKSSKVRVIQPYVGGGFGGKLTPFEMIPTLLALKTGRPVKWNYTRVEEFIDGGQRESMVIYIKDGMKKDGTIVAREMRVFLNAGAYEGFVGVLIKNCSFGVVPLYRTPNLRWDSYGVYTNEPPRSAFRGFGVAEIVWAIESNMDMMAEKLGIDHVEMRRKNILKEGESQANGEIVHSIGAEECLDKASEFIKLDEKSPAEGTWIKGKGIALGAKYSTAPTLCQARVQFTEGENVIVYHSADELGQGVNTVMAQIAAEEFGIPVDNVEIVFSDTAITPFFGEGSTSSRTTFNLGNAVRLACQDAKHTLLQKAADKLGVSPDELESKERRFCVKANPENNIRISDLFIPFRGKPVDIFGGAAEGGEIIGTATYEQPLVPDNPETGQMDEILAKQGKRINSFYAYVAKAVEVAVNIETGQIKVIRCCGAIDLGKAINPQMCEQQSDGGMHMGIGDALYEEVIIDKGRVLNPNFTDYRIPSADQMPLMENMRSILVESAPHRDAPFGAKGFGEGAMIAMEPAIANAVYDAIGVRIKDLPITSEKVLKALKEKEEAK